MTISGYEWMSVVAALSSMASTGVAGVGALLVEKLRERPGKLRAAEVVELRPVTVAHEAKAA
jgi:hypothetical protein